MKEGSRKKSASRPTQKVSIKKPVVFEYFSPESTLVTLVGDFNRWDPQAHPLKRDPGGLWKCSVRLEPGNYQYKFVVNGDRWEEDPLNLHRVPNEHGTFNSVRTVGVQKRAEGEAGPA